MPETMITLPERDEMMRRLLAVDNDQHVVNKLYPSILKGAGRERTAVGVVHADPARHRRLHRRDARYHRPGRDDGCPPVRGSTHRRRGRQSRGPPGPRRSADGLTMAEMPDPQAPLHAHELTADDAALLRMLAGSTWAPEASLTLPSGRTVSGAEITRWVQDQD